MLDQLIDKSVIAPTPELIEFRIDDLFIPGCQCGMASLLRMVICPSIFVYNERQIVFAQGFFWDD